MLLKRDSIYYIIKFTQSKNSVIFHAGYVRVFTPGHFLHSFLDTFKMLSGMHPDIHQCKKTFQLMTYKVNLLKCIIVSILLFSILSDILKDASHTFSLPVNSFNLYIVFQSF